MARALKREGVDIIFSLTGNTIDPIWDGCIDEGVRIIDVRHEQAAAHMADGWARVTGKPGAVVVTKTAGVAAMTSGILNAESSPVVAIAGKSNEARSVHEMDQVALMKPITKWAHTVHEARRIPEYVSMAFRHALGGRPGPVFLDISDENLESKVDESQVVYPEKYRTETRPQGDPRAIDEAVELLLQAERPLILGGSGVRWSESGPELAELAELVQAPFILRNKARGAVPEDHPLFLGPSPASIRNADVVLAVDIRFKSTLGFGKPPVFNEKARVIVIDIEPSAIGENQTVEVGIVGDAKLVLRQMIDTTREKGVKVNHAAWVQECLKTFAEQRRRWEAGKDSDSLPIQPARLWTTVRDFLDREAIVTADGGETEDWACAIFRAYHPGHLIDHYPNSTLGSAIPFGIAAKLARPNNQVLVCTGDGAFGVNGMEFDTAVRHKVPIVAVVGNNGCWGTCRHRQLKVLGREIGVNLGFTRYDKIVSDLGGMGSGWSGQRRFGLPWKGPSPRGCRPA